MDTLVAVQNTFKQGNLDEAYRLAHQIALSNSNSAEVSTWLGQICQAQLNYEEALQHYQKAVELQPDNSAYQYQVANIFMLQDKYEQAEAGYRQVYEKREISDAWLPCNLGRALLYQGKTEEATPFLQEAIDLNDRLAEAYGAMGYLFTQQQRFTEAINCYQKAIESDPCNFAYYHDLGDSFLLAQKYEKAVESYRHAIELNSSYFWSHKNLGSTLSILEKWEEACEVLYDAIKLDSEFIETYIELGDILSKIGRWEEIIDIYKTASRINVDFSDKFYERLGEALMHKQLASVDQNQEMLVRHTHEQVAIPNGTHSSNETKLFGSSSQTLQEQEKSTKLRNEQAKLVGEHTMQLAELSQELKDKQLESLELCDKLLVSFKENELILLQLHKAQEELESYLFKKD